MGHADPKPHAGPYALSNSSTHAGTDAQPYSSAHSIADSSAHSSCQPGPGSRRRVQSVQGPSQNPLQSTGAAGRLQVPYKLWLCTQGVQLRGHALHQQGNGCCSCTCPCSFYIVVRIWVCTESVQGSSQNPLQST
jgi:hypothetical protein